MSLAKYLTDALRPKQQAATLPSHSPGNSLESIERDSLELWMGRLGASMEKFSQWLLDHGKDANFWSSFGEIVRAALNECCGATLVIPYRVTSNGKELRALRDANPLVQTDCISARRGIVGHVLTTGRTYVAGATTHGVLIDSLAGEAEKSIAWCFVIQRGPQRLGVVTAGHFAGACAEKQVILSVAERLITQFWIMAVDAERRRSLEQYDPVCDLLTRPAFLENAQEALADSYHHGAPVAVVVLALEGLRGVNDSGRWEIADEILREVSKLLRAKVRSEDRLGRFDGARFVILLRCMDSELATLIVRQLIAQLNTVCGDFGRWGATIKVRGGLAGSGTEQPTLRDLVSQALSEAQRAREQNRLICSDILEPAMQEASA